MGLLPEPATDRIDDNGRLLRYVVRAGDGVKAGFSKGGRLRLAVALPGLLETL